MDCLAAQTNITSYVEGELKEEELKEFLLHMEKCDSCREELEIYYTLMEATRQLDEGIITTNNFTEELDDKIKRELDEIRNRENQAIMGKLLLISAILLIFLWLFLKLG